jgi:hypothetical protein
LYVVVDAEWDCRRIGDENEDFAANSSRLLLVGSFFHGGRRERTKLPRTNIMFVENSPSNNSSFKRTTTVQHDLSRYVGVMDPRKNCANLYMYIIFTNGKK